MNYAKLLEWRNSFANVAQRLPFEAEKRDCHTLLRELDEMILDARERQSDPPIITKSELQAAADEELLARNATPITERELQAIAADEKKSGDSKKSTTGKTSSTDAAA